MKGESLVNITYWASAMMSEIKNSFDEVALLKQYLLFNSGC